MANDELLKSGAMRDPLLGGKLRYVPSHQADACAWLGHWYKDINQNYFKARNCYKRALQLQPGSTMIGEPYLYAPTLPVDVASTGCGNT